MAKQIKVLTQVVIKGEITDKGEITGKPIETGVTIGREEHNDIAPLFPFVSRQHGKITYTKSFLSGKLWYEDNSTYGTFYLPPGVTDIQKAVPIHNKKVEIKKGGKLLLLDPKERKNGLSLQVAIA